MENHVAKNFALQLGSLISLYLSISFFIVLLFGLINIWLPLESESYWQLESYSGMVRTGVAMIVVFFPTYLILTKFVNRDRVKGNGGGYHNFTKWLIYLSLLVAGGTLLVDLVTVIMTFLEGDLTTRFLLKALVVLFVVGATANYYILDAKGYWLGRTKQTKQLAVLSLSIVVFFVLLGLLTIDSPQQQRETAIDQQQISDLTEIQYAVIDYWRLNDSLPSDLSELNSLRVPESPSGRMSYQYFVEDDSFKLCAEFSSDSPNQNYRYAPLHQYPDSKVNIINLENWHYTAGEYCFERTIVSTE
jgi:hypothetical protein